MVNAGRTERARILGSFGASGSVANELLAFNDNPYCQTEKTALPPLPLPPEEHVAAWTDYAAEAEIRGAWEVLRPRLPQLQFPVRAGISRSEAYRQATRRGQPPTVPPAAGLSLCAPEKLRLWIQPSPAGPIPVLCTSERNDFVLLVQALSSCNEPEAVPDSMGACIVSGFNNWDRIRRYQERWMAEDPRQHTLPQWDAEFRRVIAHKKLYQDRFLILSEGPYSNVSAQEMQMSPQQWQQLSRTIRLGHECTHYLTLRLFGSMRNHPLDELLADWAGITAACGHYRADWFLHFVGLEAFPLYRPGGRLENYRGSPGLSDAAFQLVQALVKAAADNLDRFDQRWRSCSRTAQEDLQFLLALFQVTLVDLAGDPERLATGIPCLRSALTLRRPGI
jgi:hypothetical protein